MKSTLDFTPTKMGYPCLKIHKSVNGLVVFFIAKSSGFVVGSTSECELGIYKGSWLEEDFDPFNGKIILEN
jgi:hypothetical protein